MRTSRVLFVLPMYEELQPGQVNSYTTFDWLNGGVLSLLLVKKHNFVVFCFIRMSTFGLMRHLRSLRLNVKKLAFKHALTDKESAIYKHLHYCDQIKHIQGLYSLPDVFVNENNPPSIAMNKEFLTQTVRGNTNIRQR